jgi:hypothetical protein
MPSAIALRDSADDSTVVRSRRLDTADIAPGRDVGQAGVFLRALDGQVLTVHGEGDGCFAGHRLGGPPAVNPALVQRSGG